MLSPLNGVSSQSWSLLLHSHRGWRVSSCRYSTSEYRQLSLSKHRSRTIDSPSAAILLLLAPANTFLVLRDKRNYARFKKSTDTKHRQHFFRTWVVESAIYYGLIPFICLLAIGEGAAIFEMPGWLVSVSNHINQYVATDHGGFVHGFVSSLAVILVPFLLFGLTAMALLRVYSEHKTSSTESQPTQHARDIAHLFPRNESERFWTGLLSISAGITEELSFRLLIPLLIYNVTGQAVLAIALATVWFSLVHYYQGWAGILSTFMTGGLLMFVYLITQKLWLAMLIHAIIDLNDLAIAPWFSDWLERRRKP